jgi:hypothetical protein
VIDWLDLVKRIRSGGELQDWLVLPGIAETMQALSGIEPPEGLFCIHASDEGIQSDCPSKVLRDYLDQLETSLLNLSSGTVCGYRWLGTVSESIAEWVADTYKEFLEPNEVGQIRTGVSFVWSPEAETSFSAVLAGVTVLNSTANDCILHEAFHFVLSGDRAKKLERLHFILANLEAYIEDWSTSELQGFLRKWVGPRWRQFGCVLGLQWEVEDTVWPSEYAAEDVDEFGPEYEARVRQGKYPDLLAFME